MNKIKLIPTLKLAIIGGGLNSAVGYTHLIASQLDHRWELVAACFSSQDVNNQKTIEAWNLSNIRIYNSWKDLLNKEKNKIDAVAILTPTTLHYQMVTKSLDLGIPTICEKALAVNYSEAKNICKLLNKMNGFLAVTHNYTGYPMLRELAKNSKKYLGAIKQIQIEMPQEGFARLDPANNKITPQAWRLVDGDIPSVSLDLGTHLQHIIYYLTGEDPVSLVAVENTFGLYEKVIDDVSIIANYPSGMKSVMWYGKSALGHRNGLRLRVYGTEGSAEWYQMDPEHLVINDIYGNKKIIDRASEVTCANEQRYQRFKSGHPAGFIEAFANLYVDIADKLIEYQTTKKMDKKWVYGATQATETLKILELASKSSKEKKWIKL